MRMRNWMVVVLVVVGMMGAPGVLAAPDSGVGMPGAGWAAWLGGWWQGVILGTAGNSLGSASASDGTDETAQVESGTDSATSDSDPLDPPNGEAGPWGNPDGVSGGEDESLEG